MPPSTLIPQNVRMVERHTPAVVSSPRDYNILCGCLDAGCCGCAKRDRLRTRVDLSGVHRATLTYSGGSKLPAGRRNPFALRDVAGDPDPQRMEGVPPCGARCDSACYRPLVVLPDVNCSLSGGTERNTCVSAGAAALSAPVRGGALRESCGCVGGSRHYTQRFQGD